MARTLLLVHGMGKVDDDWAAESIALLKQAAEKLEVADRLDELDVAFREIRYDDVLRRVLEDWDESADGLHAMLVELGIGHTELVEWLRGVSDEEAGFFWSHVVDVLLYRFSTQVMREVRTRVMREIAGMLSSQGSRGQLHVLAHSLGTAVIHDALAYLGENDLDGSGAYRVGNAHIDSLFAVANVSRVLERTPPVYASCVHPLRDDSDRAYLGTYHSFRHVLDPIPAVRRFEPLDWGRRFVSVRDLDHLLDFNVHALDHYLRHPDVHVPILNRLLDDPIGQEQLEEAREELAGEDGPPCAEKMEELRDRLRKMTDLVKQQKDPIQLIKAAAQLYALAEEVRDACL